MYATLICLCEHDIQQELAWARAAAAEGLISGPPLQADCTDGHWVQGTRQLSSLRPSCCPAWGWP